MTKLFVAYNDDDKVSPSGLATRLRSQGYDVFLEFDHEDGVLGGEKVYDTVLDEIRECTAMLLCFTSPPKPSQWCFAQAAIALVLGKRIFPLLFHGEESELEEFLVGEKLKHIDFRNDPEQAYAQLFFSLEQSGFIASLQPLQAGRAPYAGLYPLEEQDSPVLVARRQDVDSIIEKLQPRARGQRRAFVTIIGSSGSGKSSMIRAGLLPRLKKGAIQNSENWMYVTFTPGKDPFLRFAEAWRRVVPELGAVWEISKDLRTQGLYNVAINALTLAPDNAILLLFIDQLEELINRASSQETSKEFLDMIFKAIQIQEEQHETKLVIIATLRSDFYPMFLEVHSSVASLLQDAHPIGALSSSALREVIETPARIADILFEDGLVDLLLKDAETPDVLPLISFVMRSMYDKLDSSKKIFTRQLYREVGEIQGSLGIYAEKLFSELPPEVGNALIDVILREFIVITSDGKIGRRRATFDKFSDISLEGIDKFITGRLFVASQDDGIRTVELAHEAVFRNWQRLAAAIAKETVTIQYLRQVLQQAVVDWERSGLFLRGEQRQLLNAHRDSNNAKSAFNSSQLQLAFRSAVKANDDIVYWFERVGLERLNIAKDILLQGDPESRHHLLDYLEERAKEGHINLLELVKLAATKSQYPALKRQALRILNAFEQNETPTIHTAIIPAEFIPVESGKCFIGPLGKEVSIYVEGFEISKYCISNLEYYEFVKETGHRSPIHWAREPKLESDNVHLAGKADHPVVFVSFYDALEYCKWLSQKTGYIYRLPKEIEWEKAASWNPILNKKTEYSWGDSFDSSKCNVRESDIGDTTPVGQYCSSGGDSHYGLSDMTGNVWEWTTTIGQNGKGEFLDYPIILGDGCDNIDIWGLRVQRGGTFLAWKEFATTQYRLINSPELALQDFGFRIIRQVT